MIDISVSSYENTYVKKDSFALFFPVSPDRYLTLVSSNYDMVMERTSTQARKLSNSAYL